MQNILPESSFIPFQVRQLSSFEIVWHNPVLPTVEGLENYAYCLPMDGENLSAYTAQEKCFFGERYGGDGLGSNGGGVRCGLTQGIQIKGIGKNPLAGMNTGFWNSYGGAALEAGIKEAIFGEVCHVALPYGGARIYGLITSGTEIPYKGLNGERKARRTLILRQAYLRPAHYMRAVYFLPSAEVGMRYPHDTQRTKAAILALGENLRQTLQLPQSTNTNAANLNAGLHEFCLRLARQTAAANAKRIVHGSLNASNVCLQGSWIDFDKMSTVSDYGKFITGAQQPVLWEKHEWLKRFLTEWLFYLRKYLPSDQSNALCDANQLSELFHQELGQRQEIEFLKLSGIPEQSLLKIAPEVRRRALSVFKEIMQSGNQPFKYDPANCWEMPAKTGDFHLNTILRHACVCGTPAQYDAALTRELADAPMRARFSAAYQQLCAAYLLTWPAAQRKAADEFRILNAIRCNASLPELYRPRLDRSIEELINSSGDIAGFITPLLNKANALLAEPRNGMLDLYDFAGLRLQTPDCLAADQDSADFSLRLSQLTKVVLTESEREKVMTLWTIHQSANN